MSDQPHNRWLRYPEAAEYLGVSERQLRRWTAARRVPHTRLGLAVQFSPQQLDEFVESNSFSPDKHAER